MREIGRDKLNVILEFCWRIKNKDWGKWDSGSKREQEREASKFGKKYFVSKSFEYEERDIGTSETQHKVLHCCQRWLKKMDAIEFLISAIQSKAKIRVPHYRNYHRIHYLQNSFIALLSGGQVPDAGRLRWKSGARCRGVGIPYDL